jgi:hypothetical protein
MRQDGDRVHDLDSLRDCGIVQHTEQGSAMYAQRLPTVAHRGVAHF